MVASLSASRIFFKFDGFGHSARTCKNAVRGLPKQLSRNIFDLIVCSSLRFWLTFLKNGGLCIFCLCAKMLSGTSKNIHHM